MKLVWTIKVYNTGGFKAPCRVKIEGNPSGLVTVPWLNVQGSGKTEAEAYADAVSKLRTKPQLGAA